MNAINPAFLVETALTSGVGPDAELLSLYAAAQALDALEDMMVAGLPRNDPRWHEANKLGNQAYDMRERIEAIPARTQAGLRIKAQLVLDRLAKDGLASEIAHSLARDILSGSAAA
jgi:hypothetical protein